MNKNLFNYYTQYSKYNDMKADKSLIDRMIDEVFSETILGKDNFFVLKNGSHFIQTIFIDGQWQTEYSKGNGIIYRIKNIDEPNSYFYDFIENQLIIRGWEKLSLDDL